MPFSAKDLKAERAENFYICFKSFLVLHIESTQRETRPVNLVRLG